MISRSLGLFRLKVFISTTQRALIQIKRRISGWTLQRNEHRMAAEG